MDIVERLEEWKGYGNTLGDEAAEEILRLRAELAANQISIDYCPNCGRIADNGFSRDIPPVAYWCTKCMEKENEYYK